MKNPLSRLMNLLAAYRKEAAIPVVDRESTKFTAEIPVNKEIVILDNNLRMLALKTPEVVECDNAIVAFKAARGRISDVGAIKHWHERPMSSFLAGRLLKLLSKHVKVFAIESEEAVKMELRNGKKTPVAGFVTYVFFCKGKETLDRVCMKQAKRLKANAMVMPDKSPSVAKDVKVLLINIDEKNEATFDGGLLGCKGRVAPAIEAEMIPACMHGAVPLTIRTTSEDADWRGGKGSLNMVEEATFAMRFAALVGREWEPETDPAVLAPSITVKNGVGGEVLSLDVLFHKVNIKNAWQNTNLDKKSELVTDLTPASKRMLESLHNRKARSVGMKLSTLESFIAALIKADDSEIDSLARDEQGETDLTVRRQITNIRTLLAAGHDWRLFPAMMKIAYEKMAQKASTVSIRAMNIALEFHDGSIVDGDRYWIELPTAPIRHITTDDVQIGDWSDIRTKKHLRSIDLLGEITKKGFVTIWRSPVTHGMLTIPMEKIRWNRDGHTMKVCAKLCPWFTIDMDGDYAYITTSIKAKSIRDLDKMVDAQLANDELVLAELKAPLMAIKERRLQEIKALGGTEDNLEAFPIPTDIYAKARTSARINKLNADEAAMLLGMASADAIGVMANLANTWYEQNGGADLMRFRSLTHVLNESIIQAVKHTEGAFFPNALSVATTIGIAVENMVGEEVVLTQPRGWFARVAREPLSVAAMARGIVEFEGSQCTVGEDGEAKPWTQDTHWVCQPANLMLRDLDLSVYLQFARVTSITKKGAEGEEDTTSYLNVPAEIPAAAIARVEKTMRAMVSAMDRYYKASRVAEPFFNAKDGMFPATSKVLDMVPGLRMYNLTLHWSAKMAEVYPRREMVAILSKPGNQADNTEILRAWDIAHPSRYPLGPVTVLIRFWNATRPNSRVALFNSGRNLVTELALVAEWIRLANKEPEPINPTKEGQAWWKAFKKAAADVKLLTWNGSQVKLMA